MPLYHFHVHNDLVARDEEGAEFANLEAAKASAIVGARHLMSDEIKREGRLTLGYSIQIADSQGMLLHVTNFRDCVTIRP